MATTPITSVMPTYYHVIGGEDLPHVEESMLPLVKGDGFIWGDGKRYRVVDRWMSYDHHGHFNDGLHIFLEPVEEFGPDDRLGHLAPRYFRSEE